VVLQTTWGSGIIEPVSFRSFKRFDNRASRRLQEVRLGTAGRAALSAIAHSADSIVVVPVLIALWWRDGFSPQSAAIPVAAGFVLSVLLTSALKLAIRRRRPTGQWGAIYRRTDPHSFPSGHASRTIAMTLIVTAAGWPFAGAALLVWSALVGLSRIVLGVHYLYDVLAGYLLGLGIGAGIWLLMALDLVF
jgi:undecaprenyl-diphosphatase